MDKSITFPKPDKKIRCGMTHRHSTSQTKHHINSRTDEQFKLPQKKWTSGVGCNMILVSEIRQ
jgi:hypothetical protein